jgi:PAS domain S-box-containing protein
VKVNAMNRAPTTNNRTSYSTRVGLIGDGQAELFIRSVMGLSLGCVITESGQKKNHIVFVNQAFEKLTGFMAKEVLGKSYRFLLGKDSRQKSLEQIRDAIKNGRQCTAVVRNFRKDGSIFNNELSVSPLRDRSGMLTHFVWMQRDVTPQIEEKERMAALITDKEKRFSAYMENANEAIWRIDFEPPISLEAPESQQIQGVFNNGVFTEVNDVAARIYGYTKGKEVCGRPLKEFMKESDAKNVERMAELVRNKFFLRNLIAHENSTDGKAIVSLNNITPLIRESKVFHIWGTGLDVTELFETQDKLRRSQKELVAQKRALEEKNIALKELIAQIGLEKKDFQDRVMANIEKVVLPSFEKVWLNKGKNVYFEQHHKALEDIASSFGQKVTNLRVKLSPREIEVCNLVKNGLSNKEIAHLLDIALHTVEKHRRMSRKKLGLTHKGINLHTYLNSL